MSINLDAISNASTKAEVSNLGFWLDHRISVKNEEMAVTPRLRNRSGLRKLLCESRLHASPKEVREANDEFARLLLEYGKNPYNYPAIVWATVQGHKEVVEKFLSYGIDINTKMGKNLLDFSLENQRFELADLFLSKGLLPSNYVINGLFVSPKSRPQWEFLKSRGLLENSVGLIWDLIENKYQDSPPCYEGLYFLVEHGNDFSARIPLPGFGVREENWPGILSVVMLSRYSKVELVKMLLEKGAPINTNLTENGSRNPLLLAISQAARDPSFNEIVALMIDNGAIFPSKCEIRYCVEGAAQNTNLSLIALIAKVLPQVFEQPSIMITKNQFPELLSRGGINGLPLHHDWGGLFVTPLQYAVLVGDSKSAETFLTGKANPNGTGEGCKLRVGESRLAQTPLRLAIFMGRLDLIDLLLGHGADPNQQFVQ